MMISMPFKPKAQILLQLGEQLIKSESVAILELIKNAYDADAKNVSVSMIDIDIAFNVNQMFALQMDELVDENLMCSLTGSYITSLKQRSASCVSKQGIGVFSAGH